MGTFIVFQFPGQLHRDIRTPGQEEPPLAVDAFPTCYVVDGLTLCKECRMLNGKAQVFFDF